MRLVRISTLVALLAAPALAQFGQKVQYFPQFAVGGEAESQFTLHNPGDEPIMVRIELHRSDGSIFRDTVAPVAAGATITAVFSEPEAEVTSGWAGLSSDHDFTATLFYSIAGVGNVGVLPSNEARQLRVFNLSSGGSRTGFAVANLDDEEFTEVSFKVLNAGGQLEKEGVFATLGPQEQCARFFDEEPFSAQGPGTLEIFSSRPVVAVSLRLDPVTDGFLLSGVPVILPGLPIRGELNDVSPNIIGGDAGNHTQKDGGVVGATIGGGGTSAEHVTDIDGLNPRDCVEGPLPVCLNLVRDNFGTIGGGVGNLAGYFGTVGGGDRSRASGRAATVSGGFRNTAEGDYSAIAGGEENQATGSAASVGGGRANQAVGPFSSVPGGFLNVASGDFSFAAGSNAGAMHDNSFVWSDGSAAFQTTAPQQFIVGAGGGVGINVVPHVALDIKGGRLRLRALPIPDRGKEILLRTDGGAVDLTGIGADLYVGSVDGNTVLQRFSGRVGIGTGDPEGKLDVNGSIFQRGSNLHADYVFEDDYELESIEEHSELMWRKKHLPAVSPLRKDDEGKEIVEYGARMRGVLEELEKAHIYIEQLNARITELEGLTDRLESIERELAELRSIIKDK